jgi:hypothetical protein
MTVEEAIVELLGDRRSGELRADLIDSLEEAMRRRERNTELGGAVIAAMQEVLGMSYRDIEDETGVARSTAQRWATPPPKGKNAPS